MKRKRFVIIILSFLVLSCLFSKGANEKAYDSFWSMIEEYYPLYYIAQKNGMDLEGMREAGKKSLTKDQTMRGCSSFSEASAADS